ncbi:MAG: Uma2 family endonuclease [Cyanothece sp. SIO1E1]|nr:Uma2 family endonuclease [Cyanothece sp. SIO1E1]
MVQTPARSITLQAFLKLPETTPASEYINGQIIQKPMPQGKHSRLQRKLLNAINDVVELDNIAEAFPELRCTFGGRSTIPDIAVFLRSRIPTDVTGEIANIFSICPDWVIEILSPNQSATKVTDNILHGLEHGCQMGWLVDPQERSILVYPRHRQPQLFNQSATEISIPDFAANLKISVEQLFGWLQI